MSERTRLVVGVLLAALVVGLVLWCALLAVPAGARADARGAPPPAHVGLCTFQLWYQLCEHPWDHSQWLCSFRDDGPCTRLN